MDGAARSLRLSADFRCGLCVTSFPQNIHLRLPRPCISVNVNDKARNEAIVTLLPSQTP
jgi:hypothetical protein